METDDPRGPDGHPSDGAGGQPPPSPSAPPLTFGGVFWACLLALMVWSLLAYVILQGMIEDASTGF
jgi:hypothetical protein